MEESKAAVDDEFGEDIAATFESFNRRVGRRGGGSGGGGGGEFGGIFTVGFVTSPSR